MRIFLSWSGSHSRQTAEALHWWLPHLNDAFEPWMSAEDIWAGEVWHQSVQESLAQSQFGIVCVTGQSRESPWLLFEAGALARGHNRSKIVPYLVGIDDELLVGSPLSYFQTKTATRDGTFELVEALNAVLPAAQQRPPERLRTVFDNMWPALHKRIGRHAETIDTQSSIPIRELIANSFDQIQSLNRRQGELTLRVTDSQAMTLSAVEALATAVAQASDEVRWLRQAIVKKKAAASEAPAPPRPTAPPPPLNDGSPVFCQNCGRARRAAADCSNCGAAPPADVRRRETTMTMGDKAARQKRTLQGLPPSLTGSTSPAARIPSDTDVASTTAASNRRADTRSIPPGCFMVVVDDHEVELTLDDVRRRLAANEIGPTTLVRQTGVAGFVELAQFPQLLPLSIALREPQAPSADADPPHSTLSDEGAS